MAMLKLAALVAGLCLAAEHTPHIVPGQVVDPKKMREELLLDLTTNFRRGRNEDRLQLFEDLLHPMYAALPKNANGNINHAEARYALHRLFVQRHGWTIAGLEPTGDSAEASETPQDALMQWAPTFLVNAIEKLLGTHGMDLRELTVLAATFEDLIHKEAADRLMDIYKFLDLDTSGRIEQDDATRVITYYMALYTSGGNETVRTVKDLENKRAGLDSRTRVWLKKIQRKVAEAESLCDAESGDCGELDLPAATRVVEEIGEQYGPFNDELCLDLKTTLLEVEHNKSGRVKMHDFYNVGLHGSWNFTETPEYLLELGALDEQGGEQRVIVSNYVGSRPNCLAASTIYMICCRNECEELLGHVEKDISGPSATPAKLLELVEALPSATVAAPHEVTPALRAKLEAMATEEGNDGEVPIHSRAFAQWMHDVYPRECPRPHEGGSMGPQTPNEWMKQEDEALEPAGSTPSDEELKKAEVPAEEVLGAAKPSPCGPEGCTSAIRRQTDEADLLIDRRLQRGLSRRVLSHVRDSSAFGVAQYLFLGIGCMALLALIAKPLLASAGRDLPR